MRILKNSLLILSSLFISLVGVELVLLAFGKYDDLVSADLQASNTVWTRPANTISHQSHPDLRHSVEIKTDNFGLRSHTSNNGAYQTFRLGFFGDSYVENRRLDYRFSITSLLNELWGEDLVLNFGIDGFGLEQSYQRWANLHGNFALSEVVYFFTANDLRNMYEVQLFDYSLQDDNNLTNKYESRAVTLKDIALRWLGKARLTYLMLEAYHKTESKFYDDLALGRTFADKFNATAIDRRLRSHNEYADSMVRNALSGKPTPDTATYIQKFGLVLEKWQREIEKQGGRFYIAVLPRSIERELIEVLLGSRRNVFNLIFLPKASETDLLSRFSTNFRNDGHWNEVGNLAAVGALNKAFPNHSRERSEADVRVFVAEKLGSILKFYDAYQSAPPTAQDQSH